VILYQRHISKDGFSGTKLTKVMVRVQVRPSEPGRPRHPAENRVHLPLEIFPARRHQIQKRLELGDVRGEVGRPRAATLLIISGLVSTPVGQRNGTYARSISTPSPKQTGRDSDRPAASRHPAAVAEMADHLMC
jgi:hypothetical protein